jgi:hypothetical protein
MEQKKYLFQDKEILWWHCMSTPLALIKSTKKQKENWEHLTVKVRLRLLRAKKRNTEKGNKKNSVEG